MSTQIKASVFWDELAEILRAHGSVHRQNAGKIEPGRERDLLIARAEECDAHADWALRCAIHDRRYVDFSDETPVEGGE